MPKKSIEKLRNQMLQKATETLHKIAANPKINPLPVITRVLEKEFTPNNSSSPAKIAKVKSLIDETMARITLLIPSASQAHAAEQNSSSASSSASASASASAASTDDTPGTKVLTSTASLNQALLDQLNFMATKIISMASPELQEAIAENITAPRTKYIASILEDLRIRPNPDILNFIEDFVNTIIINRTEQSAFTNEQMLNIIFHLREAEMLRVVFDRTNGLRIGFANILTEEQIAQISEALEIFASQQQQTLIQQADEVRLETTQSPSAEEAIDASAEADASAATAAAQPQTPHSTPSFAALNHSAEMPETLRLEAPSQPATREAIITALPIEAAPQVGWFTWIWGTAAAPIAAQQAPAPQATAPVEQASASASAASTATSAAAASAAPSEAPPSTGWLGWLWGSRRADAATASASAEQQPLTQRASSETHEQEAKVVEQPIINDQHFAADARQAEVTSNHSLIEGYTHLTHANASAEAEQAPAGQLYSSASASAAASLTGSM